MYQATLYNTTAGDFDYTLLKLSASGSFLWTRNYIKTDNDRTSGVLVNDYGYKGYLLYGYIVSDDGLHPPTKMYLIEVERNSGNIINATATPRSSAAQILSEPAGFFYAAGSSIASSLDENMGLARVNKNLYTCGAVTLSPNPLKSIFPKVIKAPSSNYTLKDSSVKMLVLSMFNVIERCSEKTTTISSTKVTAKNLLAISVYPSPVANKNLFAKITSRDRVMATISIADAAGIIWLYKKDDLIFTRKQ